MTEIRRATLADIKYIDYLRRLESEAVGFIPHERYEMEIDGRRGGSLLVALENSDYVGFLYATHNRAGVTHIQQVAVQEDARRLERATALVGAAQRPHDWLLSCRCAADLNATTFWEALGWELFDNPPRFARNGVDAATTRPGRRIHRYQKVVGGLWLPSALREESDDDH